LKAYKGQDEQIERFNIKAKRSVFDSNDVKLIIVSCFFTRIPVFFSYVI